MLQELADESENQGLKMENDTPIRIYVNNTQIENVESYRDTAPEKNKARRFKEESWPDGQHSPSTAT